MWNISAVSKITTHHNTQTNYKPYKSCTNATNILNILADQNLFIVNNNNNDNNFHVHTYVFVYL